jgi:hypothetical protein
MQGSWNNDNPHYRCVYPTEYGLANHTEHPRSVYVREELITGGANEAVTGPPPHVSRGLGSAAAWRRQTMTSRRYRPKCDPR